MHGGYRYRDVLERRQSAGKGDLTDRYLGVGGTALIFRSL